jgi:16S rRNA (guanine1516-N2)-methyltransferase
MFPERQKSALVKKKLQMIQKLEFPCVEEKELLLTAMGVNPRKLVIKRPPKGPYLADVKPDYSITGKAVRFDCFATPGSRVEKFR